MTEIVARAGVALGTFYLYFASKEELCPALAEELLGRIAEASERATCTAASFEEAVQALVAAAYAEAERDRDVLTVANRSIALTADYGEWAQVTAAYREVVGSFIRRWQDGGEVDPTLDPETTAALVVDLLEQSARAAVVFRAGAYAALVGRMLRGLLAPP